MAEITLEELQQAANAGNVEAMRALVRHYMGIHRIGEAEEWVERLVAAGDGWGCYASLPIHNLSVLVALDGLGNMELAGQEWSKMKSCAETLMRAHRFQSIHLDQEQIETVRKYHEDASYGVALIKYYSQEAPDERCDEVIPMLDGIDTTKAKALRGHCFFAIHDYSTAFELGKQVMQDIEYAEKEKNALENGVWVQIMSELAGMYRFIKHDLNAAVKTLRFAVQYARDEDFERSLREELSRYKERLFGGYKYV